jgi:hypothetical protein
VPIVAEELTYVGRQEEVPVEQQYDASGAPLAQAARTVLPGEPFDPPPASMVPGPRPGGQAQPPEAPTGPVAEWNYDPAPPLYGPSGYEPAPDTEETAQYVGGSDFDALQQYATLPPAQPPAAQAPPANFAPPARFTAQARQASPPPLAWEPEQVSPAPAQPQAPPAYPPPGALLPPLPPEPSDEGRGSYAGKRRAGRKAPDRRPLTVALVAVLAGVLAGGGYFGYTQLTKKSDAATTAVTPVGTAAPRYDFPAVLANFSLQTGTAATAQQRQLRLSAVAAYPGFGKASVASYGTGKSPIIAVSFHPATAKLSSGYSAVLAGARKPATGNVVGAFTAANPGAAGGQMTCGGQRGAAPIAYCVWRGKSTVGVLSIAGTATTGTAQILARELRAYAEH